MANSGVYMPRPKRNDTVARIDAEVVRKARIVAAYRGVDLNVYLSDVLGPIVDEHLAQHAAETAGLPAAEGRPRKKPNP